MNLSWIQLPKIQRQRQLTAAILLCLTCLLTATTSLFAHPSGNFSINRYSRLEVGADTIHLLYVVDMAEVPTHREQVKIDENGDGDISSIEELQYLDRINGELQKNLHLEIDGTPTHFAVEDSHVEFPIGQADLPTQRLETHFIATIPHTTESLNITYQDNNYAGQVGWQEVVVQPTNEATLLDSTVPAEDISQELRNYPEALLQRPLAVNHASFSFKPQAALAHESHTHAPTTHQHDATPKAASGLSLTTPLTILNLGFVPILLTLLVASGCGWALFMRSRQNMGRS